MDRRALLVGIGSAIAAATAGCTGGRPAAGDDGDGSDGGGSDGGDETTTTTTITTTTQPPPDLTGTSFEAESPVCASSEDPESASVSREGTSVTVEGSIGAGDGCYTAALKEATYDAEADELRVAVETETKDSGACVQCLVRIDYVADLAFEGGLPERVVVVHEGEVVTRA